MKKVILALLALILLLVAIGCPPKGKVEDKFGPGVDRDVTEEPVDDTGDDDAVVDDDDGMDHEEGDMDGDGHEHPDEDGDMEEDDGMEEEPVEE